MIKVFLIHFNRRIPIIIRPCNIKTSIHKPKRHAATSSEKIYGTKCSLIFAKSTHYR